MNIRKGLEMVVLLVAICVAWWAVTAKQRAARSTERALAVANALNLSRDLAAGGNDGK